MTEFSTTATASLYHSIRDITPLTTTFAVVSVDFRIQLGFRFRFDGTAQRKINVEHTLAWPTNPAVWGVGAPKSGLPHRLLDPQNMPLSF
jgi:hypothetical protein